MIDSDNVLLLRPTSPESGFHLEQSRRASTGLNAEREDFVLATIYHLGQTKSADFAAFFEGELRPKLAEARISVLASFITETHPNTFPRLPVREDANVFVWFSQFDDLSTVSSRLTESMRESGMGERLSALVAQPPEILILQPTARSLLR